MFNFRISSFQQLIPFIVALASIQLSPIASAGEPTPQLDTLVLESGSGLGGFTTLAISPTFDPTTLNYTATIPFEHSDVEVVTASAFDSSHEVNITPPLSFPAGQVTPIVIVVADDLFDPTQTTTYTIDVTREIPNDNAALLSLIIPGSPVSPEFDSLTFFYTATVGFATTSTSIIPTALNPNSTITVDGTPVLTGGTSDPIPLSIGQTQIVILVTSSEGDVTKGYEVIVTRLDQDSDEDGMEDFWEHENGLNVGIDDSQLDKDFDGLANIFEYAFGSDPCDTADAAYPVLGTNEEGFATISFTKAVLDDTLRYTPEVSDPNTAWTADPLDPTGAGTSENQLWQDNVGGASSAPATRWLRIRITPNF